MWTQNRAAPQFLEQDGRIGERPVGAAIGFGDQNAQPAEVGRVPEKLGGDARGGVFQGDQRVFVVFLPHEIGGCRLEYLLGFRQSQVHARPFLLLSPRLRCAQRSRPACSFAVRPMPMRLAMTTF